MTSNINSSNLRNRVGNTSQTKQSSLPGQIVTANGIIYRPKQFLLLKCTEILVADVYQRTIDKKRVEKIQREYKTELYTAIKVYQRKDGSYYLVDGQHRYMAHVALFGYDSYIQVELIERVTPFFKNMSDEEFEAWIFEHQYDNTSKLRQQEMIKAAIVAKEPFAMDMINILKQNGFTPNLKNSSSTDNKPACIATLMRIYSGQYGAAVLDELMRICRDAFNGEKKCFSRAFLEYTSIFLRHYIKDSNYDHDIFVDRLRTYMNGNIKEIEASVKLSANLSKDIREALIIEQFRKIYNYKRKTNLLK